MTEIGTARIRLHILTPVNIGCDDVYDPTTFRVNRQSKKLIIFDPVEFIKRLPEEERKRLYEICSEGTVASILKLYQFINKHDIDGREIEVTEGFIKHFHEILGLSIKDRNLKNKINQFAIYRTAYNPYTQSPVIPGSSLKGALRTGYISSLAKENEIKNYWESRGLNAKNKKVIYNKLKTKDHNIALELERTLLKGSFSTDPFSLLKVSDLNSVNEVSTRIIYAINRKKDGGRASGPYQILETIKEGSVFEGTITLFKPINSRGVRHTFELEELLRKVHGFFARRINEEVKVINNLGLKHRGAIQANSLFKERFKKDAFLIRIGRHSGAESVTIEGNRLIKVNKGNFNEYLDHATTIYLASDEPRPKNTDQLIPLGWTVVEVVE